MNDRARFSGYNCGTICEGRLAAAICIVLGRLEDRGLDAKSREYTVSNVGYPH